MPSQDIALWSLAFAVFAHMMAMFFKSPKEAGADIERRVQALEIYQLKTASRHGSHEMALETLTDAIRALTGRIDMMQGNQNLRTSGNHRRV